MSFNNYYYPDEYVTEASLYCSECDKEFDKEIDVANGYYETNCPYCSKEVSGFLK
jgi:DNA-directed RNA polymerase subunit RPC12/RpoP